MTPQKDDTNEHSSNYYKDVPLIVIFHDPSVPSNSPKRVT